MPIDFFGLFFLGIGPGIAFFIVVISRKSFLVLVALFSAFLWLVVLLLLSALSRGIVPLEPLLGPYATLLALSVVLQEFIRYGVWMLHRHSVETLDAMARSSGHRFSTLDKLYMAMAWGYGHAACHVVFFFLSLLPLVTSDGTYYNGVCPQMSIFLVGALYSLSFGMILTCLMVIAFDGYMCRNYFHIIMAPVIHLGAAMLTVVNFQDNGCLYSMPALILLGLLLIVYSVGISWRKSVL